MFASLAFTCAAIFMSGLSCNATNGGDEDVVYVAAGTTPIPVSVEYGTATLPVTIPNLVCTAFDQCPSGTRRIDSSGNFGCNTGCQGTCVVCNGSVYGAQLCTSGSTGCSLSTTPVNCGKKGNGSCTSTPVGPKDNAGCYCNPPASYGSDDCKLYQCLATP